MALFSLYEDWQQIPATPVASAVYVECIGDATCEFVFASVQPDNGTDGADWDMLRLSPGEAATVLGQGANLPLWGRCEDGQGWSQIDVKTRMAVNSAGLKTVFATGEGTA